MGLTEWLRALMGKREEILFSGNPMTDQQNTEAAMVREMQEKTAAEQRHKEPVKPATGGGSKRVQQAKQKLEKAERPDYFDASGALLVDPATLPPGVLQQIRDGATTDDIKKYLANMEIANSRRR